MAVKTWVGRFAIVQGQPQEEGPHLRSFPRRRPDEEEDELYVLAEAASPGSEEYAGQLVDAIGRMYRQDALSITGAVLRALLAAHQQLRDWNERTLREHRLVAGVSCLAVRGQTAYLAQMGPSVAYHVGGGRFRRIAPEDGAAEPLGQTEGAQPAFSRYQLSPGDLLLLASPRIEELLDGEAVRSILLRGADAALVELFRLARDQQEFSLVLLACVVEPETEAAPAPPPGGEGTETAGPLSQEGEPAPSEAILEPPDADAGVLEPAAAGAPPAGLEQPKVRLKGPEADIRYPRTTGLRTTLPRVPSLALLGVLVVVVVGLLAWYFIPSALEESREERYTALVQEAGAAFDSAQRAEDPTQRRSLLGEAEAKLAEAEDIRTDNPQVTDLRAQVAAALDELNAVVVLPDPVLIADLSERVAGAVSLGELQLGGGGVYFLDREQQRVIALTLLAPDPEPVVLLQEGDLVGTEVVGQPQHIAWAGDRGVLFILDDARRLIAVTPAQEKRLLAVRDAQAWGSADGIAYAGGNLFVLDRAGDQVWLYRPSETGFDSEREALVSSGDLEQVVDLAVGDALYLVVDDGTVRRIQFGVEQPFPQAGIDQPLVSPASPVLLPASDRLLLADQGNKRIVVFSLEGAFRQQLVSPTFTDLRAIAVDRPNAFLFALVGGALYRTSLPPLP